MGPRAPLFEMVEKCEDGEGAVPAGGNVMG